MKTITTSLMLLSTMSGVLAQKPTTDSINNKFNIDPIVVSGTLRPVTKTQSPVPVEVYTKAFFQQNPSPNLFEALGNINGIRPQVNCNVCNTGDIHINGLEGPNTMVLIDGMPIVSGLSTVYGLSGIPEDLIERVEVVKGPASTLYGSEAVGGLINIITKNPLTAPKFSVNAFASSWQEYNVDLATKFNTGEKVSSLVGLNYFNYSNPIDKNNDNFTDLTLQNRVSVFNKWSVNRPENRKFTFAGRYVYEDRWGGEMDWNKSYRGTDIKYGESIYTSRWEAFGTYQLPTTEKISLDISLNHHHQDSYYGTDKFLADQNIYFGQLTWHKNIGIHNLLFGAAYRYTYYDDNTPATMQDYAHAKETHLPGAFVQDEIHFNPQNVLLAGLRYDYNSAHGNIFSPRINYKWNSADKNTILRLSAGNGYRVVNVFTEDHAALTGAREVIFKDHLKPETSWNGNVNLVQNFYTDAGNFFNLDFSAFYTYFNNKIVADYDENPNQIVYDNLKDHAISKGLSLSFNAYTKLGLKLNLGATLQDVYSVENNEKIQQEFTEHFSGSWGIGYEFKKAKLKIDYTGNLRSPMKLPLLSETDPRPEKSPWYSIQNIQISKSFNNGLEVYGGVKNLLDFTPYKHAPFVIARANDPFDKGVEFNSENEAIPTPSNPYGLTFDPSYVYATNQGIRAFLGVRFNLK
ncbi:TonB-dependent receptor plug domain-containing protein [Ornithobacterium rhinotracheale]